MLVSKYHYSLCHNPEHSSSTLQWKPEIMHMGFISQLSVWTTHDVLEYFNIVKLLKPASCNKDNCFNWRL
jgi:hypothetical protein